MKKLLIFISLLSAGIQSYSASPDYKNTVSALNGADNSKILEIYYHAISDKHADCLSEAIKYGAEKIERETRLNSDNTAKRSFYDACINGDMETVKLFIQAGADIEYFEDKPGCRRTVLQGASASGNVEIQKELISQGAKLNAQGVDGWTALMFAAGFASKESVEVLIKAGTNLNLLSKSNMTALMIAARYGSKESVETLVKAGANLNLLNKGNVSAISLVIRKKDDKKNRSDEELKAIAEILIKNGADLNASPEALLGIVRVHSFQPRLSSVKIAINQFN